MTSVDEGDWQGDVHVEERTRASSDRSLLTCRTPIQRFHDHFRLYSVRSPRIYTSNHVVVIAHDNLRQKQFFVWLHIKTFHESTYQTIFNRVPGSCRNYEPDNTARQDQSL